MDNKRLSPEELQVAEETFRGIRQQLPPSDPPMDGSTIDLKWRLIDFVLALLDSHRAVEAEAVSLQRALDSCMAVNARIQAEGNALAEKLFEARRDIERLERLVARKVQA